MISAALQRRDRRAGICLRRDQGAPRWRTCSASLERNGGAPDVVVYNASDRTRGPFVDLDPAEVEKAIAVIAFGGFLVAQQAARRMLPQEAAARSSSPAPRRA